MKIDVKFNTNNNTMSPEFSNSIPVGGGTVVTINGQPQGSFPADEYIQKENEDLKLEICKEYTEADDKVLEESKKYIDDKNTEINLAINEKSSVIANREYQKIFNADTYVANSLAALVDQSPETLDTLAELAAALGNDPNFATTVMELLGKTVKQAEGEKSILYARNHNGEESFYRIAVTPNGGTIPIRASAGTIAVSKATADEHAVPLSQLNEALSEKLDIVKEANANERVYGIDTKGGQAIFPLSRYAVTNTVAYRTTNGALRVGRATEDAFAVPLSQLNEALAEKLDKIPYASQVYCTNAAGTGQANITYSTSVQANTIARRQESGALSVGSAVLDNDAVPLLQMNEALAGKLNAVTTTQGGDRLYCVTYEGKQSMVTLSAMLAPYSVPMRRANGELPVGPATANEHAVPLSQLNTILDDRFGSLDSALDEILALQAHYTGETFDALHEYAEGVIAGGES